MNKKVVLITGASDGIGLALVKKFLEEGYSVIGTSRKGVILINHPDLYVVQLDVMDASGIEHASQLIRTKFKAIDILINNAGVGTDLGTAVPQRNTFEQTINTNVTGLVFFAEAMLDVMNDGGQIYNVSSQLGSLSLKPHINSTAYRMSKAAVNMYTRVLAERLRSRNINVIALHPGWVETKLSTPGAPLNTTTSAQRIYALMLQRKHTSTFWNAETGNELPW